MERILGLALNSLQDVSQINELNRHVPSLGGGLLPDATASEGNQRWRPVFPVLLHKPSRARAPFTAPRRGRAQDSPLIRELNALWEEAQTSWPRRKTETPKGPGILAGLWEPHPTQASPRSAQSRLGEQRRWPLSASLGSTLESLY